MDIIKIIVKYKYYLFLFLISLLFYFPSFSLFYTHDDFFHLLIAKPAGLANFVSYFDITQSHQGYAHYRPITTQVYYSMAWLTKFNALPMHLLMYLKYALVCFLVYKYFLILGFKTKTAKVGFLLYVTSATHFGRLYFLSTQEFGYSLFVLLSVIIFLKFRKKNVFRFYLYSFASYFFALLSKETAIVTPFLIAVSYLYLEIKNLKKIKLLRILKVIKSLGIVLLPFIFLTLIYLYFRIFYYGLASGDSYIWDFSPSVFNTLFWYGLWSMNLPELLVDFIGSGFVVNANLFRFWSKEIIPILVLFLLQILIILYLLINKLKSIKGLIPVIVLAAFWFTTSLLPVLFLPWHKFSFYLTLAILGLFLLIMSLLENAGKKVIILFCLLWLATSYMTLKLTEETHWITRGAQTAKRVDNYFRENNDILEMHPTITFVDTDKDGDLPWKPSEILKASLSDENYYKVFHPKEFVVYYGNEFITDDAYIIEARQFIGY